jgi:transposase-like protein
MCVLEQRKKFVREYETGEWTMSELCRIYEISRESGYKWIHRSQGNGGLEDRSRAPARHPNQTGVEPYPDYVRGHLAPGETWWG